MISLIETNLKYHFDKQEEQKMEYISHLVYSDGFRLNLPREVKPVILAAAISHNDPELFTFVIDLLHCNILDVRDAIRILKKQKEMPKLTSKRKVMINDHFFARLDEETLRFHLLKYSSDAFREVINLVHTHPDTFQDKTFQKNVYGEKLGVIGEIRDILKNPTISSAKALIYKYKLPFHYLRSKLPKSIFSKILPTIFETEALSVLIRNLQNFTAFEEHSKLIQLLNKRIMKTDQLLMNLGELYIFIRNNEKNLPANVKTRLYNYCDEIIKKASKEINLGDNVAIIGDASGSMVYAIEFASLLTSIINLRSKNPELIFFNDTTFAPKVIPKKFKDVLTIAANNKARGSTAPSLVIEEFLKKKKSFETLIFITDEVETTKGKKYKQIGEACADYIKQYPNTKILFLTVGRSQYMTGNLTIKNVPFTRLEITDNMDIALKSIQTLLYTLASPLLKEITIKSIQKELDKGTEPNKIVREIKMKGYYFTLGQTLTIIDDLTMLDIDDTTMIISELTKLKEILVALGQKQFAEEATTIR
ncbi:MAG: hypothetical protein FK730_13285, partial [Asgard group archaeon]|nr:hypothetical protein [Asgard group archaeon]